MFTPPFSYAAPRSTEALLALLAEYGPEAKVLSGGQSLVPLLKLRLVRPAVVVDANLIPGLDRVVEHDTYVEVGALVRHHQLENDRIIAARYGWLADVVPHIGDPQVRTLGTLAGTLVEADPAGDWSAAMLALDAEVVAVSGRGERIIPIREWFTYSFSPALEDDEFVTAVRIPVADRPAAGAYAKVEKRAGDFAVAGCAVRAVLGLEGRPMIAGVGLTGVGYVPLSCPAAATALSEGLQEDWAEGGPLTPESLSAAVEQLQAVIDPVADARGSVDYKRQMATTVLRRAAQSAVAALLRPPESNPDPQPNHAQSSRRRRS